MKKALLTVSAIAVATALITPKFIGSHIAERTESIVNSINQLPYYQAQLLNKKSNWFSQSGTLQITLDMAAMLDNGELFNRDPVVLDINFDIQSGPIVSSGLALSQFNLEISPESLRERLKWQEDAPFYRVEGQLDFAGGVSYEDELVNFSYQDSDNGRVTFERFEGKAQTVDGVLTYQGASPSISFDLGEHQTKITNLWLEGKLPESILAYLDYNQWYDSYVRMGIEKLEFKSEQRQDVSLDELSIQAISKNDSETGMGSMELVYALKKFVVAEHRGQNMELALAFNNLDVDSMMSINQLINDQSASSSPEAYLATFNQSLKEHLLALFSKQPEFNITALNGEFPQGKLDAKLQSKLVDVTELPEDLENPAFWLSHVKADSQIQMGKELANLLTRVIMQNRLQQNPDFIRMSPEQQTQVLDQQVVGLLGMLESQGTLMVDGEDYRVDLAFDKGQARVNGQLMPLGQ